MFTFNVNVWTKYCQKFVYSLPPFCREFIRFSFSLCLIISQYFVVSHVIRTKQKVRTQRERKVKKNKARKKAETNWNEQQVEPKMNKNQSKFKVLEVNYISKLIQPTPRITLYKVLIHSLTHTHRATCVYRFNAK